MGHRGKASRSRFECLGATEKWHNRSHAEAVSPTVDDEIPGALVSCWMHTNDQSIKTAYKLFHHDLNSDRKICDEVNIQDASRC